MKKIARISLFGIETFIESLHLPNEFEARLERISNGVFEKESSVFRVMALSNDSPFHLCRFVTLRNEFDLFSGKQYFGELKLSFADFDGEHWKLITVAHCRSKALEIVSA